MSPAWSVPVDLRSDTFTTPDAEMRRVMAQAEVGDDVWGEDPTVRRLEEEMAARLGKDAAVFVPSGTMGNLASLAAQTRPGDEVIVDAMSHVVLNEAGGAGAVAGVMLQTIDAVDGAPTAAQVIAAVHEPNIHKPVSRLLWLENTHGGRAATAVAVGAIDAAAGAAHGRGLRVHCDGARLFNAAVALGVDVKELTAPVDSVTFCLSKGLSCPVGSVLCGSTEFIQLAHKYRKMLGGGMRQAGVIAAAGIVALNTMIDRLADDHENARILARGLAEIPGIALDPEKVQTNLVFLQITSPLGAAGLVARLREQNVLTVGSATSNRLRLVTHYGIERADVERVVREVREILVGVPVGAR